MIKGEKVYLRAPEPADLELLYKWENQVSNWPAGETLIPFSKENLKDYLKGIRDIYSDRQLRLMIQDLSSQNAIGVIDLFDFNPRHSRAAVGVFIEENSRKKGFGKDAINSICNYGFNTLNLNQIYCSVSQNNLHSISLFSNCGFVRCGERAEWYHHNKQWETEVLFQKLRD